MTDYGKRRSPDDNNEKNNEKGSSPRRRAVKVHALLVLSLPKENIIREREKRERAVCASDRALDVVYYLSHDYLSTCFGGLGKICRIYFCLFRQCHITFFFGFRFNFYFGLCAHRGGSPHSSAVYDLGEGAFYVLRANTEFFCQLRPKTPPPIFENYLHLTLNNVYSPLYLFFLFCSFLFFSFLLLFFYYSFII